MVRSKTIIEEALDFELQSKNLYIELAEKEGNPLTKTLFQSLARQESEHIAYIKKYTQNKKFAPMSYIPIEEEIKKIFVSMKEIIRSDNEDQLTGYTAALKLENKGYTMYLKAMQEAENAEDKKFFEFLMKMEQEHYDGLANIYYFLSHNDEWLSEDESRVWNWMNL
jgi:rubrerythrin